MYVPTRTSTSSLGKRPRSHEDDTREEDFQRRAKSKKADFSVQYFFSSASAGASIEQPDRDFVAQAMEYYAYKSMRDPVVADPKLSNDIQGVRNNRDENTPVRVVFKTAKHLNAMYVFLQHSRAEHHDMIVNISVDGSGYFQIL